MTNREICIELIKILLRIEPDGGLLRVVLHDGNVEDDYLGLCSMKVAKNQESSINSSRLHIFIEMAIITYLIEMEEEDRKKAIEEACESND